MKVPGLRQIRLQRFLTQAELAQKAGITEAQISRLESGLHLARISTVRKLAAALNVEPSVISPPAADHA